MRQSYAIIASLVLAAVGMAGCSEAPPASDPRDAALNDPMNYNPAGEKYDISGGGILELDKKAMRKDVDNVLSP